MENKIIKNKLSDWQCLSLRGGNILCSMPSRDITDGVDLHYRKIIVNGHSHCHESKLNNMKNQMVCFFDEDLRKREEDFRKGLLGEEIYELEKKVYPQHLIQDA